MLVVERKVDEKVYLTVRDITIVVQVVRVSPSGIRLGFTAPEIVKIVRDDAVKTHHGGIARGTPLDEIQERPLYVEQQETIARLTRENDELREEVANELE